jgi:thioredoxin reductase
MVDSHVFVVGGANSAGQAALHLADYARQVTLVVRADSLAAGMSHCLVEQVEAASNIEVRLRAEVVGGSGDGWLERLELRDRDTQTVETVAANSLFLMIGASPRARAFRTRDQHARSLRGRRCPRQVEEPRRRGSRRGLDRGAARTRTLRA